ncbi:MAG: ATP-binding protein [Caldilineaceae bacterium]|nr:ATP-binding protein [Caldilineaceae bacterium]
MNSYIDLAPTPVSLIESLRNIGYSIETAIADVIDNSITAGAGQISIRFAWNSGNPWLAISDNGSGMTKTELIDAMRFGSISPLETRSVDDLGRFGLGMKTASFSQCRHLTVMSKKDGKISCCEWDLNRLSQTDNVGWQLSIVDLAALHNRNILNSVQDEFLAHFDSGTIIVWEDIDRVKEQVPLAKQESHFNGLIDDTRRHLALVFHRYLSPDPGKKKITINMNGNALVAHNPFNPRNLATQELAEQKIVIDGETIVIQPYVLPHHNKVSRQEYIQYSGEGGYLHNQGFYVYRNRRLIIKGTWFRLIKKEELNKLIRVRVDIPNSLDHLWKIDVKKSHAFPPEAIRGELRQVVSKIEISGRKVYQQRGQKLSTNIKTPVWNRIASGGTISYQINRDYPLIRELLNTVSDRQKDILENLITTFESSFPVDMFFNDIASTPEQVANPRFGEKDLEMLFDIFVTTWFSAGIPEKQFAEKFLSTDPFASHQDSTRIILKQRGYDNDR